MMGTSNNIIKISIYVLNVQEMERENKILDGQRTNSCFVTNDDLFMLHLSYFVGAKIHQRTLFFVYSGTINKIQFEMDRTF